MVAVVGYGVMLVPEESYNRIKNLEPPIAFCAQIIALNISRDPGGSRMARQNS